MTSKLFAKLSEPEYRKAFVASQINVGIPFQIRSLLKSRPGWTQTTLAEKAEMRQPSISALLTPGKTRPNIETLRRIADVFDCGLIVRFAPFSELAKWSEEFDPDSFSVPSFDEELQNQTSEQSEKLAIAETQPTTVSLAGLTLSPKDRAAFEQLYSASQEKTLERLLIYATPLNLAGMGLYDPYAVAYPPAYFPAYPDPYEIHYLGGLGGEWLKDTTLKRAEVVDMGLYKKGPASSDIDTSEGNMYGNRRKQA